MLVNVFVFASPLLLLLVYCWCFLSGDISWSDCQQINKTETKSECECEREKLIAIIKIQCQNGQSSRLSFPIEMDRTATHRRGAKGGCFRGAPWALACNLSPGFYRGCNFSSPNANCNCNTQLASFSYRSNSALLHRPLIKTPLLAENRTEPLDTYPRRFQI